MLRNILEKILLFYSRQLILQIGHFRVPLGLCIKRRLSAQPLIWKWLFILVQIKLMFARKVVHLALFWKWGFLELGSGLLTSEGNSTYMWKYTNLDESFHHRPRAGDWDFSQRLAYFHMKRSWCFWENSLSHVDYCCCI